QEGLVGKKRLMQLADWLVTEKRRLNQKLRDVWSFDIAVADKYLTAEKILRGDGARPLVSTSALNKRAGIQIGNRCSYGLITFVLGEWHVAQERRPVVLDLFGCCLGRGNT